MQKPRVNTLFLTTLVIFTTFWSGCTSSDEAGITTTGAGVPTSETSISGVASKGPLVRCEIKGFILESDGSRGRQVVGTPVSSASITQAPAGSWQATLPNHESVPLLLEASGVPCTFFNEATGQQQSIENASIWGLLPAGETTAALTPLTHALVLVIQDALATVPANDITAAAVLVNTAIANAAETFGFDPVRTLPPDPRDLPPATAENADQLEYATLLGALSLLLQTVSAADIPAALLTLAQDLTDGVVDGRTALRGMPATPTDLLQEAQEAGLPGENWQEVVTHFASDPPNAPGLDRAGFQEAAIIAPVTIGAPRPGGFVSVPGDDAPPAGSVNTPPAPTAAPLITAEDTTGTRHIAANDPDAGQTHTFYLRVAPDHGTATVDGTGLVHYTPNPQFSGSDRLVVTVIDNGLPPRSGTMTLNITVTPVNAPPVAIDDTAHTAADTAVTIDVVANDTDVDGDRLSVTAMTQGAHGSVTPNADGTLTYTPNADFAGTDTFTYTIRDPSGATATATVSVAVTAVERLVDLTVTLRDVTTQLPLPEALLTLDGSTGSTDAQGTVMFRHVTVGRIAVSITQPGYLAHTFVVPLHPDTTGLNLFLYPIDGEGVDTDGDGLPDAVETHTGIFLTALNTGTDANNRDTDGDGLNDGVELLVAQVR